MAANGGRWLHLEADGGKWRQMATHGPRRQTDRHSGRLPDIQRWAPDIFFMVRYRWFDNIFPVIRLRQIEVFGNLQVR